MEQVSPITEIHQKFAGWKDEVNSVREDISNLSEHLKKAAGHYDRPEKLAHVEHFQNQFICHKEVADKLYHDLKQASKRLMKEQEKGSDTDPQNKEGLIQHFAERMHTFKELFSTLKLDFSQFMEKSS